MKGLLIILLIILRIPCGNIIFRGVWVILTLISIVRGSYQTAFILGLYGLFATFAIPYLQIKLLGINPSELLNNNEN